MKTQPTILQLLDKFRQIPDGNTFLSICSLVLTKLNSVTDNDSASSQYNPDASISLDSDPSPVVLKFADEIIGLSASDLYDFLRVSFVLVFSDDKFLPIPANQPDIESLLFMSMSEFTSGLSARVPAEQAESEKDLIEKKYLLGLAIKELESRQGVQRKS